MRVALIRGSLQRNYELPTYEFEAPDQVDLFISRGNRLGEHSDRFGVRPLPSSADLLARLHPRSRGLVELTVGQTEYLVGLERELEGYDVAHGLELNQPVTLQAVRARRAGRVRRVVSTVSENIPFARTPNPVLARRVRRVGAGVDHFLPISERAALYLRLEGVPEDRMTVITPGTQVERFRPAETRRSGPVRILTVARLELGKGVEDLVIAVGILAARGVDAELTLVGEGPLHGRLLDIAGRMGIADRVAIKAVPWVQVPDAYRDSDIFVLASAPTSNWREQFGFAVIEAMASGLAVLVGHSGSLPEVVGREDVLVPPHDPLGLADRLEPLVRDETLRRELGSFFRARAIERFDHRRTAEALHALYERVLAEPARD